MVSNLTTNISNIIEECPICRLRQLRKLKKFSRDHLVRCKNCGFVFSEVRPTASELDVIYSNYSRDVPITELSRYNNNATTGKLLSMLQVDTVPIKVLDIGCGSGFFLESFLKAGCDAYGSEFDQKAIEVCKSKGIKMLSGGLLPLGDKVISDADKFDLIILTEVIEHIQNPQEMVGNIARLLKGNGIFYFTTPHFNSLERYIFGQDWGMITYPEHLSYYTKAPMDRLLKSMKLKKLSLHTNGISVYRIVQALNKKILPRGDGNHTTYDPEVTSTKLQAMVAERWWLSYTKRCVNMLLDLFGIGSSLEGVYRKVR